MVKKYMLGSVIFLTQDLSIRKKLISQLLLSFVMMIASINVVLCDEINNLAKEELGNLLLLEEFNYSGNLLGGAWAFDKIGPKNIQCERSAEDLVCGNGECKFGVGYHQMGVSRRIGGIAQWTCASIMSKDVFLYGYFEAKLKYAKKTGINNAFWLRAKINENGEYCEIDINEGHYPNKINTNVHTHDKELRNAPYKFNVLEVADLSRGFHTYGLLWKQDRLTWFFDGKKIREMNTSPWCNRPMSVRVSVAVTPWAGIISPDADGEGMIVDYVKIYSLR